MQNQTIPLAVRLIGFSAHEVGIFEATFKVERSHSHTYFHLPEDSLQDPDLYIANADELKALAALSDVGPSDVRPALLVGTPELELPYERVERPIRWRKLFDALEKLIEKRDQVLATLDASGVVLVPERRRAGRVDLDLTDPAEYKAMRRQLSRSGNVLIIDRTPTFHHFVADMLSRYQVTVHLASDEAEVIEACKLRRIALVMINTSMPDMDPYKLCQAIKKYRGDNSTAVIFLLASSFVLDHEKAVSVDLDGFLHKPLTGNLLLSTLMKFLPLTRRVQVKEKKSPKPPIADAA